MLFRNSWKPSHQKGYPVQFPETLITSEIDDSFSVYVLVKYLCYLHALTSLLLSKRYLRKIKLRDIKILFIELNDIRCLFCFE